MNAPCLLCGRASHEAHWPIAKGMGGRSAEEEAKLPRVPLCFHHHIEREHIENDKATINRLIRKAPLYWQSIGKWDDYRETFERWLALKEYKESRE